MDKFKGTCDRFFFHIAFNGYNYRGWQRQEKAVNVQQVIEETMSRIFKTPISIMGCGRTDAQVNASQYFFHADLVPNWDFDLLFRINKALPDDIAVFDIINVDDKHHARFDATLRTYDYFMHLYKDPFLNNVSSLYTKENFDLLKMKQAVALLTQYSDYRAFCKTPDSNRTTLCNVSAANLYTDSTGDKIRFQISADRFLSKMIRVIMSRLLNIGRGELSVAEFESYLATGQSPDIAELAYPNGLYLSKVVYPYLDLPPRTDFSSILQTNAGLWQPV